MSKRIDRVEIENPEIVDVHFEEGQIEIVINEGKSFFMSSADVNVCTFESIVDYSERIGTVGCMITIGTPDNDYTVEFKMKDLPKAFEIYKMLLLICGFKRS